MSSIQRSLNTLQYYTGTQNGVLIIEVSAIQRFVIERFHCIGTLHNIEIQSNPDSKLLQEVTHKVRTYYPRYLLNKAHQYIIMCTVTP